MADLASRAVFTCSTSQFAAQSQACRRLGLAKWPYQHTGPRKRRRVSGAESDDDHKSLLERVLKDVFHEFLTAVRSSDVPAASRALGSWSDREVEELWLAVRHDGAPAGTGVDVEELVHFLCSTSTSTGDAPERRNAHSADAPPDGNGDRYAYTPAHSAGRARVAIESGGARHLEDSLDECSSAVRTGATGGLQQRASARASASSPLLAQDEFAWLTASADGRPGGRVAAMSPGKLQRTESAGSTRSTPCVALRRS